MALFSVLPNILQLNFVMFVNLILLSVVGGNYLLQVFTRFSETFAWFSFPCARFVHCNNTPWDSCKENEIGMTALLNFLTSENSSRGSHFSDSLSLQTSPVHLILSHETHTMRIYVGQYLREICHQKYTFFVRRSDDAILALAWVVVNYVLWPKFHRYNVRYINLLRKN